MNLLFQKSKWVVLNMCFLENKEEIFVNISSDTYYKHDFCVILNTKYLIPHKNSNPKNLFSSPLIIG